MDEIRVAIVGAGYMAREHVRAFASVPGVVVSGIFSRSMERASALASEYGIAAVCGSIAELHERSAAALVVVTVPELHMNEVSAQCFRYPWTVLLEKPAGYNPADSETILRNAAQAGARSRTYVALNRRSYHATREALALLREADPGPRLIVVQDQQNLQEALTSGQPELVVQNWMYANSIHTIDYFNVLGRGEIVGVDRVVAWNPARPGFVIAKLEFSSGDVGLYEGIWEGPGPWAVAVTTPSVRLEMRPLESLSIQRRGERTRHAVPPDPQDAEFKPGLRYQAEQAVRAARGLGSQLATLDDAMASVMLCARIFETP